MNQILMTENKHKNKKQKQKRERTSGPIEIKAIVRFFAFLIIIFGVALVGQGSYAIYKEAEDNNPDNMPNVTVSRLNDAVIIYVEHSVEISKIIYSWNNGEETDIPEGTLTAQEEILLPNQNSVLNITIKDMNGKETKYQKQYYIEGMDITKPTIKVEYKEGSAKLTITATDDTEISYLSYQWDGQEKVVVEDAPTGKTEVIKEIDLSNVEPGTKFINIIAQDTNGNVEKHEQKLLITTSKPELQLTQEKDSLFIEASDKDGLAEIKVNINGQQFANKINGNKTIKLGPAKLKEGNNIISVEVTNINGYTINGTKELQYTP